MASGNFLYNSPLDLAIRNRGFWPYFAAYGLVFLLAFALALPAPFHLPLLSHHERTSGASIWAFIGSYPVFHALMKPRILQTYSKPTRKLMGAALGALIACSVILFLHFPFPENPVTRSGRALANPVVAAAFLAAASATVSAGCLLVLEPLRERFSRGL